MSKQKDESIYRKGWDDGFAKGAAAARFQLEAENAELRELVRDIWDAYRCEEVAPNVAKHWHDRMKELGVEV